MAVNKVVFGTTVLVDLMSDTVASDKMLSGYTAHDKSGAIVTGNITTNTAGALSASGPTVSVPAGYYTSMVSKTVSTTAHPNPTISINTSTGVITASHTQTAGYVSAGTTSSTFDLTTIAATTITPTTTTQTAVNANVYTTGTITVAPMPIGTLGTPTITVSTGGLITAKATVQTAGYLATTVSSTKTSQLTVKAAQTYTPSTQAQTIASGQYLTGVQTISGDTDLVASNIISTANIFGVQGSVVIQHYYTGSTAPTSGLGANGDIYLQTS